MNISIELLKNYKIFKNINNEDLKKNSYQLLVLNK